MASNITKAQTARLLTVYGQLVRHEMGMSNSRDARMEWASALLLRPVTSFSTLTLTEATHLIDQAQAQLGHVAPLKHVRSRRDAQRAGVEGRNCTAAAEFADQPQLAATSQTELIQRFLERLGWSQDNFEQWLQAKRSPLGGRKQIRTSADANKVVFGLKHMLRERGLWNERAA